MIQINRIFLTLLFSCVSILITCVSTIPIGIKESVYGQFITFLLQNGCEMPKNIEIPFDEAGGEPFEFLSVPLRECQTTEAMDKDQEVYLLCKEVFDVLQNITCSRYSLQEKVNTIFSKDVCTDFKNIQNVLPKQDEYLSGKLGDHMICKLLCSNKYNLLCKALFWSYDVQEKIKNILAKKITDNREEHKSILQEAHEDILAKKISGNGEEHKQESHKEQENLKHSTNIVNDDKKLEDTEQINPNKDDHNELDNINEITNADNSKTMSPLHKLNSSNAPFLNKIIVVNDTQSLKNNKIVSKNTSTKKVDENSNVNPEAEAEKEIEVTGTEKHDNEKKANKPDKQNTGNPEIINKPIGEVNSNSVISVNKTKTSLVANTTREKVEIQNNEIISELNKPEKTTISTGNKYQENGEGKAKQQVNSVLEAAEKDEEMSKPLNDLTSDNSKLKDEITTLKNIKNDDIGNQNEKEQELYNDTENDAEYAKSDFENPFNPPPKSKDNDLKSVVNIPSDIGGSDIVNSYDGFLLSRNNMGRGADETVQVIPSFPEQEDSHFFFYFLSIVLILMAGYLIFHNKQKIIALIVEGRHERRRRSHGAGYKKLETK